MIVSSDPAPAYAQAVQALTDGLARLGVAPAQISQSFASDLALRLQSDQAPRQDIFVALGSEAAQVLLARKVPAPVLCALLPRSSFERLLRSNGRVMSGRLSAIYLDQPLARQLTLVRLALPQAGRLGVLWGPESFGNARSLQLQAAAYGVSLSEVVLGRVEDLSTSLPELLADSDVLLALPDPLVFNSSTIQNILLSSFRARVPMVAFSPAYVRAGAVLALYTTPEQAGQQAAEQVWQVLQGKPLPDHPTEPNDFEVGVNAHVARSLGLTFDGISLRLALRRLERLP
ncbi:ABC transporter substrate-binding protein [Rhodoferax antarcticus]|nr:ABC transporter substrate binding protein [Rhodoferax antarcticus]MCW2311706.1 ABC-type uncharacterized transport system substrate-binding protein [Rhodoferax antarcticus]